MEFLYHAKTVFLSVVCKAILCKTDSYGNCSTSGFYQQPEDVGIIYDLHPCKPLPLVCPGVLIAHQSETFMNDVNP